MVSKPIRLQDLPKIAFAPNLPLFGVPSRSIYMRLEEKEIQKKKLQNIRTEKIIGYYHKLVDDSLFGDVHSCVQRYK